MSLVVSLDSAIVDIAGKRYTIAASSLTLPDNSVSLITATPTGYAQTTTLDVPTPGTAAVISLVTTSGGNITDDVDLRQIAGTDGTNAVPPSATFTIASNSIVATSEGVGTIKVALRVTLTAPLDSTFKSAGFSYSFANANAWHPLIPADTNPANTTVFSTTLHGLDPDQAYDIGFQAIAQDGTMIPGVPMLITTSTPSLAAQSTPTPISKVIIPKGDPTYDATNPLMKNIAQVRHLSGSDGISTTSLMGGDGLANALTHALGPKSLQTLSDASGNITGSAPFIKNMPNQVVALADVSLQYTTTSTSYSVWLTNLAATTTVDASGHITANPPQWIMQDAALTTYDMGTTTNSGYGSNHTGFDSGVGHTLFAASGLATGWKRWYIITWTPTSAHNGTITATEFTAEPTQAQKSAAVSDGTFLCICTVAGTSTTGIINGSSGMGGFNGGGGKVVAK